MKKVLALLMAASMFVALVGCGSTDDNVLTIGVDDTYPPMEFLGDDGNSTGFDIEMSKEIGKVLGQEVEFESTKWDGIFSALESKKYDCIISSVSITEERKEKYNMSDAYLENVVVLVVSPDSNYKKPEDLKGKTVAVQTDTTAHDLALSVKDSAGFKDIKAYDTVVNALDELKLGRADGVLVDIVVAKYYINSDPSKFSIVWESDDAEPIGVCMRKGDNELTEKINNAIATLKDNGKLKELSEKWFNDDITAAK